MKAEIKNFDFSEFQLSKIQLPNKSLVTLGEYASLISDLDSKDFKQNILGYMLFLESTPKRTHFLNFDDEGFYLEDNKPMFKGFVTCDEASTEEKKVALFQDTRLYFYPTDDVKGVVLYHPNFATDQCTYNEIAIAFNRKNGLEPLAFA